MAHFLGKRLSWLTGVGHRLRWRQRRVRAYQERADEAVMIAKRAAFGVHERLGKIERQLPR